MAYPQLHFSLSTSSISCLLPASHRPHRLSISSDVWRVAEERIEEMLCVFQPSVISQDRRNEIFSYGSVPLRTYLPDGDIDLTVTIVKCMVKGISLDLSFNQVSGISALCFIEQVDRVIGKDHLLKCSIILIKAWCFYESRVLGSYNGLISTYALQIMVLYIINIFHLSLDGPLSVLHKFLDYFGRFDWQSCCLTLYGPVLISSLPNVVADPPDTGNIDMLLGKEFVDSYKEVFSSPILETDPQRPFLIKNMNIVDPLNEKNNLGRSVSKGNFFRIKFAFCYGAQKIREILMQQPMSRIGQQLEIFFKNTLDRNGRGERHDIVDHLFPAFGTGRFLTPSLDGEIDSFYSNLMHIRQQQHLGGNGLAFSSSEQKNSSQSPLNRAVPSRNRQKSTNVHVLRACSSMEEACPTRSGPSEPPLSKGTGTFIPNMTYRPYPRRSHSLWVRGGQEVKEECGTVLSGSPSLCRHQTNVVVGIWEGEAPPRRSSQIRSSEFLLSASCCDKSISKPYHLEDPMDFPPLT